MDKQGNAELCVKVERQSLSEFVTQISGPLSVVMSRLTALRTTHRCQSIDSQLLLVDDLSQG